ncbi:MAG: SDR family NAD(P)-dependent oxidoreductase [Candidatus Kapabacteria bacterium]|nr:SDR family NAD(P)-dependent oxidoreductase [Candidatus Kapabacteria bacterium]
MKIDHSSVVVITGASSGLGAACALLCGSMGATVVLVARREDRLREVADRIAQAGGSSMVIVADVSVEADCNRVIDTVSTTFGKMDVLINNAGRGNLASIEDTPTEQWRSIFAVNVDSVFWLTARALPIMMKANAGHIIAISSVAGRYGHPFNAAYVAAKHAVVGFIAALRTELVGTGINATCVCPAGIVTEWADVTEGGSIGELYRKAIPRSRTIAAEHNIGTAPLSRMMPSDECAQIIVLAIEAGRTDDVFTHNGTKEIAVEAVQDRSAQEDRFEALWLAMRETYDSQGHPA